MKILLENIDKIHTTILGEERIKKNLSLNNIDILEYIKNKILDNKKDKNYYVEIDSIIITINSYNYCIITAHIMKS